MKYYSLPAWVTNLCFMTSPSKQSDYFKICCFSKIYFYQKKKNLSEVIGTFQSDMQRICGGMGVM